MTTIDHGHHGTATAEGSHDTVIAGSGSARGPTAGPLALQVAAAFWIVLGVTIAHGVTGGSLWPALLAFLVVDYAWYLRRDSGVIVWLLEHAPWNGARAGEGSGAGADSALDAVRLRDVSVHEMFAFAADEVSGRWVAARRCLAAVTVRQKAAAVRWAVFTVGLLALLAGAMPGLALCVLALLDFGLQARIGTSAAMMPFDDDDIARPRRASATNVGGAALPSSSAVVHTVRPPSGSSDEPLRDAA